MESSRRDLFIAMVDDRFIFKYNQISIPALPLFHLHTQEWGHLKQRLVFTMNLPGVVRFQLFLSREILCLHDLPPLSPKLRYFARSGPPFVIRSVIIGWGCPKLQMVDLSARESGLWGRERGDRANTDYKNGFDR